jgi:predicted CXXCH cytochrome family protein
MKLVCLSAVLLGCCAVAGPAGAQQKPAPAGVAANRSCLGCHTKLRDRLVSATSRHLPPGANSCTDCHESHAGRGKPSLKQPVSALCASCHSGLTEGKKFVHGAMKAPCTVCHDPHASAFPHTLRAATNDLCLECHAGGFGPGGTVSLFGGAVKLPREVLGDLKPLPVRAGHPVPYHPVFASADIGLREINCLSCHTAHASEGSPDLLVSGASGRKGLCGRCHSAP